MVCVLCVDHLETIHNICELNILLLFYLIIRMLEVYSLETGAKLHAVAHELLLNARLARIEGSNLLMRFSDGMFSQWKIGEHGVYLQKVIRYDTQKDTLVEVMLEAHCIFYDTQAITPLHSLSLYPELIGYLVACIPTTLQLQTMCSMRNSTKSI